MAQFRVISNYKPTGDQPQAIAALSQGIKTDVHHQVLLGVTGSGKTFTMSKAIEQAQRPALIISPNKTLAAQLYQEFKEFFPENGIHYFVSYYDYYQPEAYIPQSDTYIEKDSKVNETIDRLRHEATQDVLSRRDAIVVASVSCIYNIGSPKEYHQISLEIHRGKQIKRKEFLSLLTALQYARNDIEFKPGTYRIRGESIEIFLVTGREILRIEFYGNTIEEVFISNPRIDADFHPYLGVYRLYPAKFWVVQEEKLKLSLQNIRTELEQRLHELKQQGKLLEAERLEQRTNYDLEMIEESGYCHGIENYSRHLEFRDTGDAPYTLLDYFDHDFLVIIDESHLTLPQIRAMSVQDKMRKQSLIDFGFRLPSAIDNRPLRFEEFLQKANQLIYVSATPGDWEQEQAGREHIIEQLVRPTGLLEPTIEIRPTEHQIQNLISEIEKVIAKKQRALVVTLTKRLAEEVSDYLQEHGIRTKWLHSEVKTLERPAILEQFRRGEFDVLVGINLLREGLDLPEVALVTILDADKEGFLRNETTLIQTMGRAARHPEGRAILYADQETGSMKAAIREIERRRKIQENYNKKHGITPQPIIKGIRSSLFPGQKRDAVGAELEAIQDTALLEKEMKEAASHLDFERAAAIRDLLKSSERGRKGKTKD